MVNWWIFGTPGRSKKRINKIIGELRGEISDRYDVIRKEASEMNDLMTLYERVQVTNMDFQDNPTKANLEVLRNSLSLLKSKLSQIKKENLKIEHLFLIINHDVQTTESLIAGIDREKARR